MDKPPFEKVLIANRGEIAIRVMRACRELGIVPVAVYSEADRDAAHVREAFEAVPIGPAPSRESYLRVDRIVEAALKSGAQAVHPGYGFLAERSELARAVAEAGLTWIGPPPDAMDRMGDKVEARRAMEKAGVPVVPGTLEPLADDEARSVAERIGFPIMIKASAGGGGKGMRRVDRVEDLASALRSARSEATSAFGDGRVYVERAIDRPRHVEIQVFSDAFGNHLHLFERDCSVQRRHQKLVEESPCAALPAETRAQMCEVATRATRAIDYRGAGTLEFLLAPNGEFYFLEMNTRLQVEHPVTELVLGIDLVQAQILVAAGRPAPFRQEDLVQRGHAIEVRICAEDPQDNFRPSPGRIESVRLPGGPWVRLDGALYPGYEVPVFYDPLLAKLIVWAPTRLAAIDRMKRALRELSVTGIRTNIPFFIQVMRHGPFIRNEVDTGYIGRHLGEDLRLDAGHHEDVALLAAAILAHEADAERARRAPNTTAGMAAAWPMAGRLSRLGRS